MMKFYADDTICMTRDENAMNGILSFIEREGSTYGFQTNRKKCECLHFGEAKAVKFQDGTPVPKKSFVNYPGCSLNDRGDPAREVNTRIKHCMATLNILHPFFYHSDNSVARHLQGLNNDRMRKIDDMCSIDLVVNLVRPLVEI